jgi:crossover junction endodeoxyribonuclease RuvC
MRIMGVDPGAVITGYGIIDQRGSSLRVVDSGIIAMRSSQALALRLQTIYDTLLGVIDRHAPDEFCIETAFYGKNVRSTLTLGHVRGVALLAAAHRQLGIAEYSPREVKKAVTGSGAAAKQQMAYMVTRLLGLARAFASSDEADALGIALCHASRVSSPRQRYSNWSQFAAAHPERVRR